MRCARRSPVLSARIDRLPEEPGFRAIKADIEALSRLVNQLLSAAQADTLVVDPQSQFDLSAMAEEVVSAMAPLAIREGRGLALEASGSVAVRGDADAIAHALRNLVENALRYSPAGAEVLVKVGGGRRFHCRGSGARHSAASQGACHQTILARQFLRSRRHRPWSLDRGANCAGPWCQPPDRRPRGRRRPADNQARSAATGAWRGKPGEV